MFKSMTPELKAFIRKKITKVRIETFIALGFLFALALFFLIAGIIIPFAILIALGVGTGIGGFLLIRKSRGEFNSADFWIQLIEERGDEIIWVKPFKTKHTLGLVITLFEESNFQIFTKDGLRIHFKMNNEQEQKLFFEMVRSYFKDAQVGYSGEVEMLYQLDKSRFKENLIQKGLYTPISTFS
ncbi:MAG: hypothetical protein ACI857_003266 [Arenicella sp.]|jgi:hypothetical protein